MLILGKFSIKFSLTFIIKEAFHALSQHMPLLHQNTGHSTEDTPCTTDKYVI
jgi:hypothetical protein